MNTSVSDSCAAAECAAPAIEPAVRNVKLIAAALVTLLCWSGAYVAISIAARELTPASLTLARLGTAALILLIALPVIGADARRLPRREDLPAILLMALLGYPVYHFALNTGQRIVPAGVASLLIATLPIFAAIVARITLKEKPSLRGWLGIFIAFGGVALLVAGRGGGFNVDPYALFIVLSALSGSGYMVLQRRLTQRYSGFALTIWGMWLGSLVLVPFTPQLLAELPNASAATWLAIGYLGLFPTALAYVTWAYVLKMLPAARATSLLYVVPPVTFVLAWLILGDMPSLLDLVSGVIIIGGVALVQRNGARRKTA